MKIRNKSLQIKIKKLTDAVIDLLDKRMEKHEYPTREYPKFSFEERGFNMEKEVKIDFGLMIFNVRNDILQLSEFIECAEYMVKNPTIRRDFKVVDKEGKPVEKVPLDIVLASSLHPFLVAYFNQVGSLTFDEVTFNDVYSEFEKHFYIKVERYSVTSPLENLSCKTDKIDLGKGLRIRQISEMEKSAYLRLMEGSMAFSTSFGALNILDIVCVLETIYLHKKGTPMYTSSCRRSFEDVVTALRLFKSGQVDFNVLRTASISLQPHFGARYGSQGRYTSPLGPKYKLLQSEVTPFKRIWKRYKKFRTERAKLRSNKYLNIALRRFNLGIEEADFENKMIDYLISFEALYLPERDELTYRLSNRVATLLGKGEEETEKIRKIITKAYNLRSDIVHGRDVQPIKIEGETVQPSDFISTVEECLRKSVRLFIALSKTYKTQKGIIEELDKSLLNVKSRKKLHRLTRSA